MLNADHQGFLIGEVLDVSKSMLRGQQAGLETLSRIDSNLSSLIGRSGRIAVPRTRSAVVNTVAVEPAGRRATVQIGPYGQPVPKVRASSPSTGPSTAPSARDARGRFVARGSGGAGGAGGGGAGGGDSPSPEPRSPDEARSSGDNRLVEAIKDVARETTDRMDPMIEAAKEVWEPLGRGWRASFGQGAEKKKERWYKRILQAITRKKDGGEATAAASGGGSGMLSGIASAVTGRLSGLVGMIPTLLSRVFAPVAAAWAAWEVGQWIGGKVHDWLVSSGLQDKMFAWIDSMRAGWSSMLDRLLKAWENNVKKPFEDNIEKPVQEVWNSTKKAVSDGVSWVLGQTSKRYESGGKGAAAVSSGKGDLGGASYGEYQLSSKKGTLSKFLSQSGYADQFSGMAPGSREFNAKWREMAKDQSFVSAQHDFIRDTHFNPLMKKLAGAGLDMSGRGAAVQDAIWSTSVQFGGSSSLVEKALKGRDISTMSDADIVSAIQDYKIANNSSLFKSSDDKVRAGTLARAIAEKSSLVSLASKPMFAGMPVIPKPSVIAQAEMPNIPTAQSGDQTKVVVQDDRSVGQNVADRSIAHITTGGMGK